MLAALAAVGSTAAVVYWRVGTRGRTVAVALAAAQRGAAIATAARAGAAALATRGYALLARLRLPHAVNALRGIVAAALRRPAPP